MRRQLGVQQTEGSKLRRLARNHGVDPMLTYDAIDSFNRENISVPDALYALGNASIVGRHDREGNWLRVVQGQNIDGEIFRFVVLPDYANKRIVE